MCNHSKTQQVCLNYSSTSGAHEIHCPVLALWNSNVSGRVLIHNMGIKLYENSYNFL